jgi:hypothetical protein
VEFEKKFMQAFLGRKNSFNYIWNVPRISNGSPLNIACIQVYNTQGPLKSV